MSFPPEFPLLPPKLTFVTKMWHPNSPSSAHPRTHRILTRWRRAVYPDGRVCISILHAPGNDEYGYEDAGERWLPVHGVESIVRPSPLLCYR